MCFVFWGVVSVCGLYLMSVPVFVLLERWGLVLTYHPVVLVPVPVPVEEIYRPLSHRLHRHHRLLLRRCWVVVVVVLQRCMNQTSLQAVVAVSRPVNCLPEPHPVPAAQSVLHRKERPAPLCQPVEVEARLLLQHRWSVSLHEHWPITLSVNELVLELS